MRILYVEDNPTNVLLVERVARLGKHTMITYAEGQLALDRFEQDQPQLVLMDVELKGQLTGLDVTRQLRAKGHTLPIIALTAYAMKGDRQRCIEAGCDNYIAKPVSIQELVAIFKYYDDALTQEKTDSNTVATESASPIHQESRDDEKITPEQDAPEKVVQPTAAKDEAAAVPSLVPLAPVETAAGAVDEQASKPVVHEALVSKAITEVPSAAEVQKPDAIPVGDTETRVSSIVSRQE